MRLRQVRANHPYEVCEVIGVPIVGGNPPYMKVGWPPPTTCAYDHLLLTAVACLGPWSRSGWSIAPRAVSLDASVTDRKFYRTPRRIDVQEDTPGQFLAAVRPCCQHSVGSLLRRALLLHGFISIGYGRSHRWQSSTLGGGGEKVHARLLGGEQRIPGARVCSFSCFFRVWRPDAPPSDLGRGDAGLRALWMEDGVPASSSGSPGSS